MKWIKNRSRYLNEAKIRDVISKRQSKEVSKAWGQKYLDYEEVTPTDNIKQGKWKLSEEDKLKALGVFFNCDMDNVFKIFNNLPDKFADILHRSLDIELLKSEKHKIILKDFNIKSPTIDQIVVLYDNIFKKLSVSETKATEMVQRDEQGRPVRDSDGNIIKVKKESGDPIYSSNLVNIASFVVDYNSCYPDDVVFETSNEDILSLINLAKENHNTDYKFDFEIFNRDVYLSIKHNPKDILNISISKFFSSCQHLYEGGYRGQLLSNVFDPNSIPAFLLFETPIKWDDEIISDTLPLSRMFIRNIESFDDSVKPEIFFDRAYPDRMKDIFSTIIEKYSGNIETNKSVSNYYFTPDIDITDDLSQPYMDRLRLIKHPYIGVNTKSLYLNRNYNWSRVKISPNAKIKELVIETTDLPQNLLDMNIKLEWVKFKYLDINNIKDFSKIKTDSIAFDKCKIDNNVFMDINLSNPDIKRLQLISCDMSGFDFSIFKKLEELQIIYTIDSIDELSSLIKDTNLKKIIISGDLVRDKHSKDVINSLRKSNIKIEIVGPTI